MGPFPIFVIQDINAVDLHLHLGHLAFSTFVTREKPRHITVDGVKEI